MIHRRQSAFTLIEVVVAMTIFGIGILGVVTAIALAGRASTSSDRLAGAVRIAERQLVYAAVDTVANQQFDGEDNGYRWHLSYEPLGDRLVTVRIDVSWQDRGEQREYILHEIVSKHGVTPDN